MHEIIELIRNRRTIRTYAQGAVDRRVIEEIVDCGRLAPTAMNEQPWDFVAVTERNALCSISPMIGHAQFISESAFSILVLARPTQYAVEDCSCAIENMALAAEAYGLGSCWIAGTQQPYAEAVAAAFGAPADHQLIAIVSFGIPGERPSVEKRPLASVLHWERF